MQIKSLRIKSYRSWRVADTASEQAIARMKQLELYATLKSEGLRASLCLQATAWSKAKYYRWLKRYRQQGWARLESQSCRPKHTPQASMDKTTRAGGITSAQALSFMGQAQVVEDISPRPEHGFK